jgi:Tol biopolymer transport system component
MIHSKSFTALILALTLLPLALASCGNATVDLEPTLASLETLVAHLATQVQDRAALDALSTHSAYLSTQVMSLRITPTPVGGVPPTPETIPAPPGLVYVDKESLWIVGTDRQPLQLLDRSDAVLSPDGDSALVMEYEGDQIDIWMIDLATQQKQNITNTPDRNECCVQWWLGRPESVVFGSQSLTEESGPTTGHLSISSLDGSNYRLLDAENNSNALPGLSPDGESIAYDRGGEGYIYHMEGGPETFDPASYGISASKGLTLGSPSWSPDGRLLAWVVGGDLGEDGSHRIAIAVFDLEASTGSLLHPYIPIGRGGWPSTPKWSPDGQWLAFLTWDEEEPRGLWVAQVDGAQEYFLGDGSDFAWSPDSQQLAFTLLEETPTLWLVQLDEWKPRRIYLPESGMVRGWLNLDN